MTGRQDSEREAEELFEAKAVAELTRADALVPGATEVRWSGQPIAGVMLVKGEPGAQDRAAGRALAGAVGEAARKALGALGYGGPLLSTIALAGMGTAPDAAARRVRLQADACGASVIVALDARAAEVLARAFGVDALPFGSPVRVLGRTLLAVDDLEAALVDPARKKRVWRQMRALATDRPARDVP